MKATSSIKLYNPRTYSHLAITNLEDGVRMIRFLRNKENGDCPDCLRYKKKTYIKIIPKIEKFSFR